MPSESRPALTIQTEKPNHYSYLKEFRVEQCSQFLQHKCTNHRPFTCFHWHFNNQRRRRPVRKRDGSFNYSPDSYCTKYDETTGICPDGDECLLLHRTAGDTERRYHLRYYKTCMCVHDTDSRGFCVKNGPHCAFAHGSNDLRPPVYDVKELQAMENADTDSGLGSNGPNVLDKERNLMNEDPKWQDTAYVLAYYKTEPCKRPPRLCRQGYACPQYHNSRDKRRSPRQFKYRSTPCPSVKHGDEWGETSSCDAGDLCAYCHTRTEQQFHPEIYKSTRCNDVQQSGYCPRGVFCAFAHVDQEMALSREAPTLLELKTSLADILSNALPPDSANQNNDSREEESSHSSPDDIMNRHLGVNKEMLNQEKDKQEKDKQSIFMSFMNNDSIPPLRMNFITSDSHLGTGFFSNDNMDSVLENTFEDLNIEDPLSLAATMDRDLENDSPTVNSISQGIASTVPSENHTALSLLQDNYWVSLKQLLGSSAPMNIPGGGGLGSRSVLPSFNSPPTSSPLPVIPTSAYMTGNAFQDPLDTGSIFMNHASTKIGSFPSSSGGGGGLYNFSSAHMSPTGGVPTSRTPNPLVSNLASISPSMISNSLSEIQRLREEVKSNRQVFQSWDDRIQQARTACEAWKREAEEANLRANIADQQKEEALSQINLLRQELDKLRGDPLLHALNTTSEAKEMPIHVLQSLQLKLKSDLETINKIITDRSKNNGGPILNSR